MQELRLRGIGVGRLTPGCPGGSREAGLGGLRASGLTLGKRRLGGLARGGLRPSGATARPIKARRTPAPLAKASGAHRACKAGEKR